MDKQYITKNKSGTLYYKDRGKHILHRTDGPAIEFPDGNKQWVVNGVLHRLDGPATENDDGSKQWFVNGEFIFALSSKGELVNRMK